MTGRRVELEVGAVVADDAGTLDPAAVERALGAVGRALAEGRVEPSAVERAVREAVGATVRVEGAR